MPVKGECHQVIAGYFSSTCVNAVSDTSEFLCANLNRSIEMTSLWIFVEPSCVFAGAVFLRHPKLFFFFLYLNLLCQSFYAMQKFDVSLCTAYRFVFFFAGKSVLAILLCWCPLMIFGYWVCLFANRESCRSRQAYYLILSHPSPCNLATHPPCNLATHPPST